MAKQEMAFATRDLVICRRDMQDIGQGLQMLDAVADIRRPSKDFRQEQVDGMILLALEVKAVNNLMICGKVLLKIGCLVSCTAKGSECGVVHAANIDVFVLRKSSTL